MRVPGTKAEPPAGGPSGPPRAWSAASKGERRLRSLEDRLAPAHTALVLVDLQNDFCHPAGFVGRMGEDVAFIRATLPRVRALLAAARAAGVLVVHVRAEYGPLTASDVSMGYWAETGEAPPCCLPDTWGAEFVAGLEPAGAEPVVVKHRYSAFVGTRLELLLRSNTVRTLVVPGVATHCCVESTVRDAAMRDFYVVVPPDGVAVRAKQRHLHDASLEVMGTYFARLAPVRDVEAAWRAAPARSSRAGSAPMEDG